MQKNIEILESDSFYHVFNRANGQEKLFFSKANYDYFLQNYKFYISPIADTYCFCLMPNHFHFLIQIKGENEVLEYFSNNKAHTLTAFGTLSGYEKQNRLSKLLSLQFSHLFNGYTQAINKERQRRGSLFMRPYKRKRVLDLVYLRNLVQYIHLNPVEAGYCESVDLWPYSSYKNIFQSDSSFLKIHEVIDLFGDLENFKYMHMDVTQLTEIKIS